MKDPSYIKQILDKERILEKIKRFIPKNLDQSDDNIFSVDFTTSKSYPDNYLYIGKSLFCGTTEAAYYFLNFSIKINDNSVYFLNCKAVSLDDDEKENFYNNKDIEIKETFLLHRGELYDYKLSKLFFDGTYEKFLSYF